jgi:hypothetical protein
VRYPVSKTGGPPGLGGSTPSPSALEAWPSRQGSALLPRRRPQCRSQVRVLLPPLIRCGRAVRRATVTREAQVRFLPPELTPPWSNGDDAGLSIRKRGFESRRGYLLDWAVDGWPKGVTEQRLTPWRCEGRNVHSASLRGEGISLAVHGGGWQACRRATNGTGRRSSNAPPRLREASPSSQLLCFWL